MIETIVALLFAHTLADYVLQNYWMVSNKHRPVAILLHSAVVLVTAQAALGNWTAFPLLVLAGVHLAVDLAKTHLGGDGLAAYLADQIAHLATVAAIAWWMPNLWQDGLWASILSPTAALLLIKSMLLCAGLILATRAGGFAICSLMRAHAISDTPEDQGLPGGGATIGHLERLLICLLVLVGEFGGIGFLVAAKSILRFGSISGDRKATEYVIIGTLFSFGWALTIALAMRAGFELLPTLEIGAARP